MFISIYTIAIGHTLVVQILELKHKLSKSDVYLLFHKNHQLLNYNLITLILGYKFILGPLIL